MEINLNDEHQNQLNDILKKLFKSQNSAQHIQKKEVNEKSERIE